MLNDADADARKADVAHATAFPVRLPTLLATFPPALATWAAAFMASGPCVCTADRIAGRFVFSVAMSFVMSDDAIPSHSRLACGGVHMA
jgi:hypothetical protein